MFFFTFLVVFFLKLSELSEIFTLGIGVMRLICLLARYASRMSALGVALSKSHDLLRAVEDPPMLARRHLRFEPIFLRGRAVVV